MLTRDDGERPDELVVKHEDVLRVRREATAGLPLRRADYAGVAAGCARDCAGHARASRGHASHTQAAPRAHTRVAPEDNLPWTAGRADAREDRARRWDLAAGRPRGLRFGCALRAALAAPGRRALAQGSAVGAGHPTRLAGRLGRGWPPRAPHRLAIGPPRWLRGRAAVPPRVPRWQAGHHAEQPGWLAAAAGREAVAERGSLGLARTASGRRAHPCWDSAPGDEREEVGAGKFGGGEMNTAERRWGTT
jgi:hypothetical protein